MGGAITSEARCTREIISRIGVSKAAFSMEKTLFTRGLDLNLGKKLVNWYIWSTVLYGAETWDISESRSEMAGKV